MKNSSAQDSASFRFVSGAALTVTGRAASVPADSFQRLDAATRQQLPKRVSDLATNSSGICITFRSDTKNIKLNWVLKKYNVLWNMTPVAINGLDLYGWNGKSWQFIHSARPLADTNSVLVADHLDGKMRHYRIYLPLYASLASIAIGVDEKAIIEKADPSFIPKKKVVIYGSSITQGASASRPGMAYPSLIARDLDVETFNMGFSGNGKMELPVADAIAGMAADVYILDCVPNPSPQEIRERAVPFIKRLRALKPHVPIIMVESIFRETAHWDSKEYNTVINQNKEFRKAYDAVLDEGYKNIYYIPSAGLIGDDHEATIDGTHLTDLGFTRLAKQIEKVLVKLLQDKTHR